MKRKAKDYLSAMNAQEKRFGALYRQAAATFGLSECAMWVLYFLISSDEPLTQQELTERMMFPKQTINSAVMSLAQKDYLELRTVPEKRSTKQVVLSPEGEELALNTVKKMRTAEERAVKALGQEKIEQFIALHDEFLEQICTELERMNISININKRL
jgi:DNA-binding MarR family transcriptional regulator